MQPIVTRLKPYTKRIVFGQTLKFIEVILELLIPLLIARMVEKIGIALSVQSISHYLIICVTLAVCGMLAAFICQYHASVAAQSFGTVLRNDVFRHILALSEESVQQIGTSSLTTRITSDIQVMQQGLNMFIRLFMRTPFICLGSIIMVAIINPKIVWLFIAAVLIFSAILYFVTKAMLPLIKGTQTATDRLTLRLLELLTGIKVIRVLVKSREKGRSYERINQEILVLMQKLGRVSSLLNPLTLLALNLIGILILRVSGHEIQLGNLNTAEIIALINYLTMLLTALIVLANLVLLYTRVYASSLRLTEVLNIEKREEQAVLSEQISFCQNTGLSSSLATFTAAPPRNSFAFNAVDFSYPASGKKLFKDFDFALPDGKSLGIIGPTGSGKSSIAYLLERRYPVTAGEIKLFDRALSDYSERELLSCLQIVPQKSFLFSGTLRESLTYGLEHVADNEIWQALQIAQASDFVAKNKAGLEQIVARGGLNFSGGQRQRLCIARALLRKPRVLIFDDSSSALDLATDAALQKALRQSEDFQYTIFVNISQRIASVAGADLILLLDNGKLKGFGTHRELLAENVLYQEIYQSQIDLTKEEQELVDLTLNGNVAFMPEEVADV